MIPRLRRPALAARDERALRLGAWVLAPALLFVLVVRPLTGALVDSRAALASERSLLGRELSLLAEAPRDRQLLHAAERAVSAAGPRLFGGTEPVSASAELARYVAAQATRSGLALDQAETETVLDSSSSAAVPDDGQVAALGRPRPLRVSIRAHGEVDAIAAFLQAMENGPKLVRVEELAIAIADTTTDNSLSVTATLSGLARSDFSRAAAGASSPAGNGGTTIAVRGAP